MVDVASKAGVAKGTIYLHFKDKDALDQAIALDGLRILSKTIQDNLVGL
jgi:AcrR family transcriptional regulator